MTPEELEDIRSTLEFVSQAGAKDEFMDTTFNLLEFIDEQAAQISVLREELDVLKLGETAANKLILRGRNCEEQVEALKEKLVRERAENLSWQNWSAGGNGFRVYPGWEKMMPEARTQLKAEMPEVGWE